METQIAELFKVMVGGLIDLLRTYPEYTLGGIVALLFFKKPLFRLLTWPVRVGTKKLFADGRSYRIFGAGALLSSILGAGVLCRAIDSKEVDVLSKGSEWIGVTAIWGLFLLAYYGGLFLKSKDRVLKALRGFRPKLGALASTTTPTAIAMVNGMDMSATKLYLGTLAAASAIYSVVYLAGLPVQLVQLRAKSVCRDTSMELEEDVQEKAKKEVVKEGSIYGEGAVIRDNKAV